MSTVVGQKQSDTRFDSLKAESAYDEIDHNLSTSIDSDLFVALGAERFRVNHKMFIIFAETQINCTHLVFSLPFVVVLAHFHCFYRSSLRKSQVSL